MRIACHVGYVIASHFGLDPSVDLETKMTKKNSKTGPASADHLQALTSYDLRSLTFGSSAFVRLKRIKINMHVARGGYTGEDGFEVRSKPTCGSSFTGTDSRTDLSSSYS